MNEDYCQDCFHPWEQHNITVGCMIDWKYADGVAVSQGCECLLAHVERSSKEQR